MTDTGQRGKRQVVIVGAASAGLFAVRALGRSDVSVTMIDRVPAPRIRAAALPVRHRASCPMGRSPLRCVICSRGRRTSTA